MTIVVDQVEIPAGALVASVFERVDHADAFAARLPGGGPGDVDDLARRMFSSSPRWVDGLMRTRDTVVRLFGLKTSGARVLPERFEPGATTGIFRVYARTDDEILFGEDDTHLDFRVSILVRAATVTMTTVVRFHGARGRAYFAFVRPFHALIVPAMIRSALAPT